MEAAEILLHLREKNHLTQTQMAERLHISRQAVSRWENGETVPNTDTLKLISKEFNVSVNTLLGLPRQLICQCCGMPLYEDDVISRETDGEFNEEYCKWCYHDGEYVYHDMQQMVDFCIDQMKAHHQDITEEKARELVEGQISQLKHWKK